MQIINKFIDLLIEFTSLSLPKLNNPYKKQWQVKKY